MQSNGHVPATPLPNNSVNDSSTQLYSPLDTLRSMDSRNTSIIDRARDASSASPVKRPRCLLACSGSVATVKVPELAVRLSSSFDVLIIATQNAMFFLKRAETYNPIVWQQFQAIGGFDLVLEDSDEWNMWNKIGNDILHIDLRRWANVLVVAPASANVISKASVGICDNLLLSLLRAWELKKRPCLLCPAMNTVMWEHPATQSSLATLKSWGWRVVGPVEKMLACKEVGSGAMAYVEDIVEATRRALEPTIDASPYVAEDDGQSSKKHADGSSVTNIPHQIWQEKYSAQAADEMARLLDNQQRLEREVAACNQRYEKTLEELQKQHTTMKMIVISSLLLLWGVSRQFQSVAR